MASRPLLNILVFSVLSAALLGCHADNSDGVDHAPGSVEKVEAQNPPKSSGTVKQDAPAKLLLSEWRPESFSLTCAVAEGCPEAVGLFVFAGQLSDGRIETRRCVGTLIGNGTQVISSGHCDSFNQDNFVGFFISRGDLGRPVEIRQVVNRGVKVFTPGPPSADPEQENTSQKPDAAVFTLDHAITTLRPASVAQGTARLYSKLSAYVINEAPDDKQHPEVKNFKIDRKDCDIGFDEQVFPFNLVDRPNVLRLTKCDGVKGNSGGPFFAANDGVIEALWDGSGTISSSWGVRRNVEATNLRCVSISSQAAPCVGTTMDESNQRVTDDMNSALKRTLRSATAPATTTSSAFNYSNFPDSFVTKVPGGLYAIEFKPICHQANWDGKKIVIPSEKFGIAIHHSGTDVVSLASNESIGTVVDKQNDLYQIRMEWQPSFGESQNPDKTLRGQIKDSFWIALPPCAR